MDGFGQAEPEPPFDLESDSPIPEPRAPDEPEKPLVTSVDDIAEILKLSEAERSLLDKQGFVVTRNPGEFGSVPSPIYDRIYQRDLPVFISSDSILYAFHRQYVDFLEQLEAEQLTTLVRRVLSGTRESLVRAHKRGEVQTKMAKELDVYLTVGLSLLDKAQAPALAATSRSRIKKILRKVAAEQHSDLRIFNKEPMGFDFTQFKPRGHYRSSEELSRYFRCIMWLGRVPLEILSYPSRRPKLERKGFDIAATLSWLIHESGSEREFAVYQDVLDNFVGPGDDDTPIPVIEFLKGQGVTRAQDIRKISDARIKTWLKKHAKERSRIATHQYFNSSGVPNKPTPRNFMMIGQRFTLDSHILGSLVFDKLVHPKKPHRPILRKLPKSLDVIAALGNSRAKAHLQEEFKRYPYEGALDQIRDRVAKIPKREWTKNVHSAWLAAIASLHKKPDDPALPKVFRSDAWKDKTLQTQLASWAELRHDHILYVKQSLSGSIGCEFPDAYVEPVPHFYAKVKLLVGRLHAAVDKVESQGLTVQDDIHRRLEHFSEVLDMLQSIAAKQLKHRPLDRYETRFLKQAVESEGQGYGPVRWDGWYPKILGEGPAGDFEPTIADVHTDPPDQANGFVARVLHAGTGAFELATILVDCPGNKKCAYVGPVSTFYEFIPPKGQRLTDEEWRLWLSTRTGRESRPSWIRSFRLPDVLTPHEKREERRFQWIMDTADSKEEVLFDEDAPDEREDEPSDWRG